MRNFALIGKKLGHSWSQQWFCELFAKLGLDDYRYELHEMVSLDGLRQWVDEANISGFNVTIPYKQAIIPLLDALSPDAKAIGAVNCVCVSAGRLIGHNTDAPAFASTLSSFHAPLSALILGTGGAARAVGYALGNQGIEHLFVSRNPDACGIPDALDYAAAAALPERFNMLINATPVGMWPNVEAYPWPADLRRFKYVYDLIYNPSPTLLMQRAAACGATVTDGLAMLHRQAELSWQLWQNTP